MNTVKNETISAKLNKRLKARVNIVPNIMKPASIN